MGWVEQKRFRQPEPTMLFLTDSSTKRTLTLTWNALRCRKITLTWLVPLLVPFSPFHSLFCSCYSCISYPFFFVFFPFYSTPSFFFRKKKKKDPIFGGVSANRNLGFYTSCPGMCFVLEYFLFNLEFSSKLMFPGFSLLKLVLPFITMLF